MDLAIYVPLIIVGIIGFQLILRALNKATIKKSVEKDMKNRKVKLQKRIAKRKSRGGTKFKEFNKNPNEAKWNRLNRRAQATRK